MAVSVQPEARALGDDFVDAAERALSSGQPGQVSDAELERVMTAAVRLYAAKAETDTPPAQADHAVGGDADRCRGDGERPDPRRRSQSLGRVDVVQSEKGLGELSAMREVNIGPASEFADPGRKIIGFDNFEVAVFKLGGEFFAYLNHCPHMGGPACQGKMIAKVEEIIAEDRTSKGMMFSKSKLHVVCPWHGFEFDIRTGRSPRQSEGAAAQDQGRGCRRRRDRHRAGCARACAGDAGSGYYGVAVVILPASAYAAFKCCGRDLSSSCPGLTRASILFVKAGSPGQARR